MTAIRTMNGVTVHQRLQHELRTFTLLAAYLYVCFGALVLVKMSILGAHGIGYLPFGIPIVKALILAKFIMLGEMVHLGEHGRSRRIVSVIAEKALLFLVLLIVLSIVEEALIAAVHGESMAETLRALSSGKLWQVLANSFVMLLILIPYMTAKELDRVVDGKLWTLLTQRVPTA